jgi:Ca-activated chloride channel family protein
MKTFNYTIRFIGLAVILAFATATADTITLSVETDKPVALAGETQTAYLRIGITGCPVEILKERTPVNVAIVIDKSGSMSGKKIEKAKEAAILALHRLKSDDIVSVVLYDSDVQVLVPATKMTRRETIIRQIRRVSAGGSTALYAGVQNGAEEVRKFLSRNRVNRIVLLSDGLANVGPDTPAALGQLGANLVDEGISVTTIGLGLGYNEDLMTQLAYKSDGGHYFAETADELAGVFDHEFGRALSVVAQDVTIEIICGEDMRPVRLLGREGVIKGRSVNLEIQNIYSEHEKYAILEVEIPAQAKDKLREMALVRINYQDMKSDTAQKTGKSCHMRFTDSKTDVEKAVNKRVLADAVEQIAIENNKRALALRDAGKIAEAQQVLYQNAGYLRSNAAALDSDKLAGYAGENEEDAENLDAASWGVRRKAMRESQTTRQTQR